MNYAQLSDFDYDQDGDLDLFVFDRSSDNIRVFTQEVDQNGAYYKYAHNAEMYFPQNLRYRVALVDYDQDGRKDLFTWALGGGLKVYRNTSDVLNGLQWTLFKDIVFTDYAISGINPLSINADDIPALVDVDNDGDLDVLTSDAQGLRVEYHQSVELYGIPDSLIFVQKNECWGQFTEGLTSFTINLNDSTPPCVSGNIANPEFDYSAPNNKVASHQGTTILCLDIDSSGVKDLIMGDATYSGLTLLTNSGTTVNANSPMISYDDAFPSYTTPVKCYNFPAAFFIDVNFDGKNDLLASPNATVSSLDRESVILYQNNGTNAIPVFSPSSNNFLQSEMIEHGTGAIPTFVDYNDDGLQDLVIGNYYNYKAVGDKESTLALYYNVGSPAVPVFEFVDNDLLNLSQANLGLRTVPAFGDIDGDGDPDLFLGLEDGTLVFYENLTTGGAPIWVPPIFNFADQLSNPISVSAFAFPQLFDLDQDGLLDLLIGNRVGNIAYYRNVGSSSSASFELIDPTLGEVDILPGNTNSNASIHFFRAGNETHLFSGSFDGDITYYSDIDGAGTTATETKYAYFDPMVSSGTYYYRLKQVDYDGSYSYSNVISIDSEAKENAFFGSVFPNPTKESFTLTTGARNQAEPISISFYSSQLQLVKTIELTGSTNASDYVVETQDLKSGVYSVRLKSGNDVELRKVVIL
ncbi:T9SS type A sorting domain-containing protein [Crocinitomicaceae bacterium]|nr:T9SS type A sorting domain-containing protein [Crocinitomicaceae bacterium]